jgi:hypothetical protein
MVSASVKGVTFASVHPPTAHRGPPYTLANPMQSGSHSKILYGPASAICGHGSAAANWVLETQWVGPGITPVPESADPSSPASSSPPLEEASSTRMTQVGPQFHDPPWQSHTTPHALVDFA